KGRIQLLAQGGFIDPKQAGHGFFVTFARKVVDECARSVDKFPVRRLDGRIVRVSRGADWLRRRQRWLLHRRLARKLSRRCPTRSIRMRRRVWMRCTSLISPAMAAANGTRPLRTTPARSPRGLTLHPTLPSRWLLRTIST